MDYLTHWVIRTNGFLTFIIEVEALLPSEYMLQGICADWGTADQWDGIHQI